MFICVKIELTLSLGTNNKCAIGSEIFNCLYSICMLFVKANVLKLNFHKIWCIIAVNNS